MLILASKSPRRQLLLRQAGVAFEVRPSRAPEAPWDGAEPPADYVRRLALAKATEVSLAALPRHPQAVVLGADTVVALGNRIFGKPKDLAEAKAMLSALSGRCHAVYTGVALVRDGVPLRSWTAATQVWFKPLTAAAIDLYCGLAQPLDKAGAYGIQEHGELIVEKIDGLLSNVIGLPVEEVLAHRGLWEGEAWRTHEEEPPRQ